MAGDSILGSGGVRVITIGHAERRQQHLLLGHRLRLRRRLVGVVGTLAACLDLHMAAVWPVHAPARMQPHALPLLPAVPDRHSVVGDLDQLVQRVVHAVLGEQWFQRRLDRLDAAEVVRDAVAGRVLPDGR